MQVPQSQVYTNALNPPAALCSSHYFSILPPNPPVGSSRPGVSQYIPPLQFWGAGDPVGQ